MFRGTIIENSLSDKNILKKLKVEKTWQDGEWTLHSVWIKKEEVPELSKCLADGPWYIHLWEPGKDDVEVVFKNKVFSISFSNRSTWVDVIAYGKSIGIPLIQLDFPIE